MQYMFALFLWGVLSGRGFKCIYICICVCICHCANPNLSVFCCYIRCTFPSCRWEKFLQMAFASDMGLILFFPLPSGLRLEPPSMRCNPPTLLSNEDCICFKHRRSHVSLVISFVILKHSLYCPPNCFNHFGALCCPVLGLQIICGPT